MRLDAMAKKTQCKSNAQAMHKLAAVARSGVATVRSSKGGRNSEMQPKLTTKATQEAVKAR